MALYTCFVYINSLLTTTGSTALSEQYSRHTLRLQQYCCTLSLQWLLKPPSSMTASRLVVSAKPPSGCRSVVLLSLYLSLRLWLEWNLERRRNTRLTRTTQGCQQRQRHLTTRVLIRRETADATVIIVSLAIRAQRPPAAYSEESFITMAIVTQHSGISLWEFIGTATYSRRMARA